MRSKRYVGSLLVCVEIAQACISCAARLQVLAGSNEQLVEAQKEVKVMTKLHHPNLLPLLAQAVVPDSSNGRMLQVVYMLFPVYQASTSACRVCCQGHIPFCNASEA